MTTTTTTTTTAATTTATRRFLTLPHPRSHVPVYFLPCPEAIYEQTTIGGEEKNARSWFISSSGGGGGGGVVEDAGISNQIHTPSTLTLLTPLSPLFLVLSILSILPNGPDGEGRFLPYDDIWDQAALVFYRRRREKFAAYLDSARKRAGSNATGGGGTGQVQGEEDGGEESWEDIVSFGAHPLVQRTVERCCQVQSMPDGPTTYRLCKSKAYALLDDKLTRLASPDTFARAPNTLSRSFDRRYQGAPGTEASEEAQVLRRQIAAETIMGYLSPDVASEWSACSEVLNAGAEAKDEAR
ncbi:uncharacterized protein PFL1_00577 [Pseudozyma flocculosa PF-1]|nr:uncharacterized protein PFL1_00577 [Pseudozyma flocculosa PF-1]EPQ32381.1 hypothetical protein PFL1_00577 [Pseudozyma flocculosa PF-1]